MERISHLRTFHLTRKIKVQHQTNNRKGLQVVLAEDKISQKAKDTAVITPSKRWRKAVPCNSKTKASTYHKPVALEYRPLGLVRVGAPEKTC